MKANTCVANRVKDQSFAEIVQKACYSSGVALRASEGSSSAISLIEDINRRQDRCYSFKSKDSNLCREQTYPCALAVSLDTGFTIT